VAFKMVGYTTISYEELRVLAVQSLEKAGVPSHDAFTVADILCMADLMGIDTHGTKRLIPYIARIHDGIFNPTPALRVVQQKAGSAVIDGDNGLGPLVGSKAFQIAFELVAENGVAFVCCRNSQHFGAIAPYLQMACDRELVSFVGTNAYPTMAPWGGKESKVGNNPLGFGAPRRSGPHFILDIAMSIVARSKIRKSQERNESIPEGWAVDEQGVPTTDPSEALNGFVLPIGGHKGYGIALAVDILAGVLSGGAVADEVNSLFKQKVNPQRVGHFFIVIDPKVTIGLELYYERMEALCAAMKSCRSQDGDTSILLPGEIEADKAEKYRQSGVPIENDFLTSLRHLAEGEVPKNVPQA
jgi:ureidoglycolate dehydrogenase (NAD+)